MGDARRRPARSSTSSSSRRRTAPRRSRSPTSTTRTSCSPARRCPSPCRSPRARHGARRRDDPRRSTRSTRSWQQRLASEWAALLQLQQAGRLPARLLAMASCAQERRREGRAAPQAGARSRARTRRCSTAWVYAASATDTYDIARQGPGRRHRSARSPRSARSTQLDQLTTDVFKKIGAIKPTTLGGHLLMMARVPGRAARLGLQGVRARVGRATTRSCSSCSAGASPASSRSPEVAESVVEQRRADGAADRPDRRRRRRWRPSELEFETEKSVNYMCSIPNMQADGDVVPVGGAAGVNYFETLLVEPARQAVRR